MSKPARKCGAVWWGVQARARMCPAATAAQVAGVVGAMLLIDRVGRRPLLLAGSAVTAGAMTVLAMSDAVHSAALVLAAMCAFIVAFSMSWAGVFWVLMSEIFSMPVKSPAVAAATAALFLAGGRRCLRFSPPFLSLGSRGCMHWGGFGRPARERAVRTPLLRILVLSGGAPVHCCLQFGHTASCSEALACAGLAASGPQIYIFLSTRRSYMGHSAPLLRRH